MTRMKRLVSALLAGLALALLAGCTAQKADSATPKDYTRILHDARSDEENDAQMIFTKGEDGKYTAQYGYSAEYTADELSSSIENFLLPLLGLEDGMYEDFAASVSGMMIQSYGIAIVKPAAGRTGDVQQALEAFVTGQQQAMDHYLEDQYQIAKAAKVEVVPTGEVVLVCCEDSDAVLASIKAALAA